MSNKEFRIVFTYSAQGEVIVEAYDYAQAIKKAKARLGNEEMPRGDDIVWQSDEIEVEV